MPNIIGIDHIYITVSDIERASKFYNPVMKILGFRQNMFTLNGEEHIQYYNRYFGYVLRAAHNKNEYNPYSPGLHHLCLRVETKEEVQKIAEMLNEINIVVSNPRVYTEYAPDYYAIFLNDPDGIQLEVTNYRTERRERHDNWD